MKQNTKILIGIACSLIVLASIVAVIVIKNLFGSNNLSDITDKYTKLKIEFEKQKQYCIQLNLNIRNQKKRNTSTASNSTKEVTSSYFRKLIITHFFIVYQNKNNKMQFKRR